MSHSYSSPSEDEEAPEPIYKIPPNYVIDIPSKFPLYPSQAVHIQNDIYIETNGRKLSMFSLPEDMDNFLLPDERFVK